MTTFAIIKTGGKQYKVALGDILKVEKLPQEKGEIKFDDILEGKKVVAEIIGRGRAKKVRILKFRSKKRYHKVLGHRQSYSEIRIKEIK